MHSTAAAPREEQSPRIWVRGMGGLRAALDNSPALGDVGGGGSGIWLGRAGVMASCRGELRVGRC